MATYRVQKRLSTGQEPGDIVSDDNFNDGVAAKLCRRNALKLVDGPPLTELPGWIRRAELLATVDIVTADQFLEADDELIQHTVDYRSVRAMEQWKEEVRRWLMPPPTKRTR